MRLCRFHGKGSLSASSIIYGMESIMDRCLPDREWFRWSKWIPIALMTIVLFYVIRRKNANGVLIWRIIIGESLFMVIT